MKRMMRMLMALMALLSAARGAYALEIISGLDGLPIMSAQEAAALPEAGGAVALTLKNGQALPYDVQSNTYLIPQSDLTADYEGEIAIAEEDGFVYYLIPEEEADKRTALQKSLLFVVLGVKEEECRMSKIIFTSLPVLCIETQTQQLPGDEDTLGSLRIFSIHGDKLIAESTAIEINERGNTSRRFPKRSYRVKLVDDRGEKRNLPIAGLRSDDDWILNPMYTDTSKIREKLAYELWQDVNSSGSRAASSRLEYAEVFFGEKYWGLYGVQERVDNKQVSGSKRADVLYKVTANDRPTVSELLHGEDRIACRAFEAQYGDEYRGTTRMLWTPAASYMAALEGEPLNSGCKVDLANAIDYGLWTMLTQAHDCHFKNQFLNCVYTDGGYTMYKIPWDVNHTFGDVWYSNSVDTNYSGYVIGDIVLDGYFKHLLEMGDPAVIAAIQARWQALREGIVNQENILNRADTLYRNIYPAIQRDSERWPQGGMGEGNALNIWDIQEYVKDAIPRMDAYINGLSTQEEGQSSWRKSGL